MTTLQELSNRHDIERVLIDYVHAIDSRDFDALDAVFTPDAVIDYTAMGGIKGAYPEIRAWLPQALAPFPGYCHLLGNVRVRIEGDRATSRCACFNPVRVALEGGGEQVMFLGLWYVDEWRRTEAGWRIERRVEEKCFDHNVPEFLKVVVDGPG